MVATVGGHARGRILWAGSMISAGMAAFGDAAVVGTVGVVETLGFEFGEVAAQAGVGDAWR